MVKQNETARDPIVSELSEIKRLLVFALARSGASQDEIAEALGVSQSSVSRMFPSGLGRAKSKGRKMKGSKRG